jgi:hypothetical protein
MHCTNFFFSSSDKNMPIKNLISITSPKGVQSNWVICGDGALQHAIEAPLLGALFYWLLAGFHQLKGSAKWTTEAYLNFEFGILTLFFVGSDKREKNFVSL